jgi:hypothetical protein
MKDGFNFQVNVGPGEDDPSLISVPMDCMKDFVKAVCMSDRNGAILPGLSCFRSFIFL